MSSPEDFIEQPWPQDGTHNKMCDCPACGAKEMIIPTRWEKAGWEKERYSSQRKWRVGLRCVECEAFFYGVFSEDQIESLDKAIDDGEEQIADTLQRMEHENMTEEASRFILALHADLIGPDDFTPPQFIQ